jgi:hypothetical protein
LFVYVIFLIFISCFLFLKLPLTFESICSKGLRASFLSNYAQKFIRGRMLDSPLKPLLLLHFVDCWASVVNEFNNIVVIE